MIERAILRWKIKRAHGDFSTFMSRYAKKKDVVRILQYATKKANNEQRQIVLAEKSS